METAVVNSKGQVVISEKLRKKFSINPGTIVGFIERKGELILQPLTKEYFESLAGWLKGDVIGELMKEKKRERKL